MFGWEYPPLHSGGLGVACQGLVKGLLKHGAKVTLVLPHPHAKSDGNLNVVFPTDELCETVKVESLLQPYDSLMSYEERLHLTSIPRDMNELYGADLGEAVERFTALSVEMTRNVDPDIVHCHDWMTYEAGIRASRHHTRPLVSHVHATELDRTDFHPNEWIMMKERNGLLGSDRVIAVSDYTKQMLMKHYGIPGDKISVVHNGHDHEAAPATQITSQLPEKKAPLVLFLGRLTVQKNPVQFLEVAKVVHKHNPDAQFVMAGDGGMLPELLDRACDLGLSQCITFTGKVNKAEAKRLFAAADCFVMPSLSEPFGLVALEAIGHGTPVILSKQSGAAEVVEHAFKVDFWDTGKMADCILTILREEALAGQLINEAPSVLNRLTWKNQAGAVHSIYNQMIT